MKNIFTKRLVGIVIVFTILGGALLVFGLSKKAEESEKISDLSQINNSVPKHSVIGSSAEGRDIEAYTYGNGEQHLAFVGGIHGGYEWNSVLLSYKLIDYFNENSEIIPKNISITIIPSANPDGVYKVVRKDGRFGVDDVSSNSEVVVSGRFNSNDVDLNRNFDCKWKPKSTWRGKTVSAGSVAFSEPEAKVIQDFVSTNNPTAVIFYHSQSNAVYASECENGILPETIKIMNVYSKASNYPAVDSFDSYEITGDAEGWLASINIPAITVELKTHEAIDWEKNLAGVKALFEYYKKQTN